MKQAAASPMPTVRALKANAGQKAAPSWVENQAISAPTSTMLQITGGRGASARWRSFDVQSAASRVAAVPTIQSRGMGEPRRLARKQPTVRPGMASGNRKGRTVMASATRNWMPPYWGMGSSSVRAA